jgi:SAM-dependent methyltransferase
MKELVEKYSSFNKKTLDVGSYDVLSAKKKKGIGCYRSMFEGEYCGLDIENGPNVDLVVSNKYNWNLKDESFDLVISGQCLEHTEAFWLVAKEASRVCRKGGFVIHIVPWKWRIHKYPIDCWRILPDGMKFLLEWCELKVEECGLCCEKKMEGLCYGVGKKIGTKK